MVVLQLMNGVFFLIKTAVLLTRTTCLIISDNQSVIINLIHPGEENKAIFAGCQLSSHRRNDLISR